MFGWIRKNKTHIQMEENQRDGLGAMGMGRHGNAGGSYWAKSKRSDPTLCFWGNEQEGVKKRF